MGFLDRLIGSLGGSSAESCPKCGSTLDSEHLVPGSYWCQACGSLYRTEGGALADVKDLREAAGNCEACRSSLSGGESYLPYEDGSNSDAYVKCPSCGHENIRYGFGEDD